MALLNRFWTMVKSNLNHLIGKAEDPEKMLTQMLLDMQEQLISAKKQVALAIADEKRIAREYEQEHEATQQWEKKAMMAVKAGRDDLAKQSLQRKTDHHQMAQNFQRQWQAQKEAVVKLKEALHQLSAKIEDAKRRKNLLVARAKRAQAQQTITETMSGMSQVSASETLDRMQQKINEMEAEAAATTELAEEASTDQLSSELEQLQVSDPAHDDALAALKSKMGLSAPAQEPLSQEKSAEQKAKLRQIEEEIQAEISVSETQSQQR
ncbi:MAG: PspA/IM30 family protein [Myxococcota bacterium]